MRIIDMRKRTFAFNLIELLIVIAIIALLVSLVLATITSAKEKGKSGVCISNHKQIVEGWALYSLENNDNLPWTVDDGDNLPFTNWVAGQLLNKKEATNIALLVDTRRSLLAQHVPNPNVYKCPSDKSEYVRSVSMNNRLNPVRFGKTVLAIGGYGTNYQVYRKLSDIHCPLRIFVTLDERFDSINEGNFAVDMSNSGTYDGLGFRSPYWWLDTPASYHNKGGTFSFADGHVSVHKWQEKTTLGPIGRTGFRRTKDNDRDIAWVQYHTAQRVDGREDDLPNGINDL